MVSPKQQRLSDSSVLCFVYRVSYCFRACVYFFWFCFLSFGERHQHVVEFDDAQLYDIRLISTNRQRHRILVFGFRLIYSGFLEIFAFECAIVCEWNISNCRRLEPSHTFADKRKTESLSKQIDDRECVCMCVCAIRSKIQNSQQLNIQSSSSGDSSTCDDEYTKSELKFRFCRKQIRMHSTAQCIHTERTKWYNNVVCFNRKTAVKWIREENEKKHKLKAKERERVRDETITSHPSNHTQIQDNLDCVQPSTVFIGDNFAVFFFLLFYSIFCCSVCVRVSVWPHTKSSFPNIRFYFNFGFFRCWQLHRSSSTHSFKQHPLCLTDSISASSFSFIISVLVSTIVYCFISPSINVPHTHHTSSASRFCFNLKKERKKKRREAWTENCWRNFNR